MLDSVAVTLPRTPLRPLTAMLEGYGNALVLSRILIKVVFEKVWTSGRVKLKLTRPRLFAPSCSCRTAGMSLRVVQLAVGPKETANWPPPRGETRQTSGMFVATATNTLA